MDWDNLKELNCPKDYKDLSKVESLDGKPMFECECGFKITEVRLREIVEPMYTKTNDHYGRAQFEELMQSV